MKSLLALITITIITFSAVAEHEMILKLTTGNHTDAGTDNLKVYVKINGDDKYKYFLNRPDINDYQVGATDEYRGMKFDLPLDKIKKIVIGADHGPDKWLLRKVEFQVTDGKKISEPMIFKTKTWISAEKNDKNSKLKKTFTMKKIVSLKLPYNPKKLHKK